MRGAQLKAVPLFALLSPNDRAEVAAVAEFRDVAPGAVLFRRADVRSALFVVLTGRLRLTHMLQGRRETLALINAPGFLAEQALVHPTQLHEHTATADLPTTLLVLPGAAFLRLARKRPALGQRVLASVLDVLTDRLISADTKLLTVAATGRIAASAHDLDELSALILRTVLPAVRARLGLFVLFRPEQELAVIREALGYRKRLRGRRLPLRHDPVLGRILRSGEPLVVSREETLRDPHWRTLYGGAGLLAVPLIVGTHVVGALFVAEKRQGKDFSSNNQLLLTIVAQQIAVAVATASIEEQERMREELDRIYIKPL